MGDIFTDDWTIPRKRKPAPTPETVQKIRYTRENAIEQMAKAAKKETSLANLGPKVVVHHEGGRRESAMALLEWMRQNTPATGQQIIDAHGYARNTFHSYISLLMHEGHVEISNHKSTPVGKTSWALGIYTVKTKQ